MEGIVSKFLRKLNDRGIELFGDYLAAGAVGAPPLELLENPKTSDAYQLSILLGDASFADRYQFGIYLRTVLAPLDQSLIANDQHLWTSLALYWFDRLCPAKKGDESRDVKESYRYILSDDYRHYYRHLVRSPWQLVRQHGTNAQLLLIAPRRQDWPLSVHGEILEQFGARQQVLASRSIIHAAFNMYFDIVAGRPRRGVSGAGRGSARRFGLVLRQLDLTYDSEAMPDGALLSVLPPEFDKWKSPKDEPGTMQEAAGIAASVV